CLFLVSRFIDSNLLPLVLFSSFNRDGGHRHPPSFPTRRSSDLEAARAAGGAAASDGRSTTPATAGPRGDSASVADGSSATGPEADRKSTRLNSSHVKISYAVFCLKKKKIIQYCVRVMPSLISRT